MNEATSRPRRSLTKTQLATPAGVELLSLCEGIVSDGRVTETEITDLRDWLNRNRDSGLPSQDFLAATVERILADGQITPDELAELHKALETVLPPDLRKGAQQARRSAEALDRQRIAKERADVMVRLAVRIEDGEEDGDESEPIEQYDFMAAGSNHDGRDLIIRELLDADDPPEVAYLRRDAQNPHSRNAVEVRIWDGRVIGYVPEWSDQVHAKDVARYLDDGARHRARIKRILTGGRSPIAIVAAEIFDASADVEGAVTQAEVPGAGISTSGATGTLTLGLHTSARPESAPPEPAIGPTRTGCTIIMLVLLGIGVAGALVARLLR